MEPLLRSTPVTALGLRRGGGVSRVGLREQGSAFAIGPRVGTPAPRSKFQGRRRQGGHMGRQPDARLVLQERLGSSGVPGGPLRLQTRTPRTSLALGPSTAGGGAHAGRSSVAGAIGVARAAAKAGVPARRRRIGLKVPAATGPPTSSLPDLALLAAPSGGLVRPPP